MPSSKINAYPLPAATRQALVHEDLWRLVEQMQLGDVMRFANIAQRTNTFAALGFSPPKGALSVLQDTESFEYFNGSVWVGQQGHKLLKRGFRITSSNTTTNVEIPVLRLDGIPTVPGRLYMINTSSTIIMNSTVANDNILVQFRYQTGGAAATVASARVTGRAETARTSGAGQASVDITGFLPSPGTDVISVLMTVVRSVGTGNVSLQASVDYPIDMLVWDCGIDPGNSGVALP